jgi:hypothetical protein
MAPYRTGIPTILRLLNKICQLMLRYDTVVRTFLTEGQITYWEALQQACDDFVLNIDHPNKGD